MSVTVLRQLTAEGVSLWLDGANRERLDGRLAELISDQRITGVRCTVEAVAEGLGHPVYQDQLRDLAARGLDTGTATRLLLGHDARRACDRLAPVHEATDGRDGLVSLEIGPVPPTAALAEARAWWWAVDRPNLLLRMPVGAEWLPVVEDCLAEGIGVDVGPVVSPARQREVLETYLNGLERARAAGLPLARIASVATIPLNQLDHALDAALQSLLGDAGRAQEAGHRACTAVARLAYREYERWFDGERWRALADAGARPQRLMWTATEAPGPAGPDTRHVDGFVAWGVVSLVSENTLAAVADHALLDGDTVSGRHISAGRELAALARLGIEQDELTAVLEAQSLAAWTASWAKLRQTVSSALELHRL